MFIALRRTMVWASDYPRSRRFYGEVLGLPEVNSFQNDWVEFGLGPVLLKLVPLRHGEVPARNQVAIVLSTGNLEHGLTELKERGVTVSRGVLEEFYGRSAEILDPDGYRIVLWQAHELHPDEEWVPMSMVEERVKQKLAARRHKVAEKVKGAKKKAPQKGAPRKSAPQTPRAKTAKTRKVAKIATAKKAKKTVKAGKPTKKAKK